MFQMITNNVRNGKKVENLLFFIYVLKASVHILNESIAFISFDVAHK